MYELKADEKIVWKGEKRPTKETVQRVGDKADAEGWNGICLALYKDGKEIGSLYWTAKS